MRYKYDRAFINRFHDPELACLLGVSTNGVMPLAGPHDCNLDEQMKKYLNGYDIRNLPGLLAFSNRMDDMFEVVLDRGVKRPGFTTLDGVFHPV